MKETQVWFLVWEDPTCHGATKPVRHDYWGPCALPPAGHSKRSLRNEKPMNHSKERPTPATLREACWQQQRPSTAENTKVNLKRYFFAIQTPILLDICTQKWDCWIMLSCFSRFRLFTTLRTVAHQAPPPMGCSRQEYWSGLPCPPLLDHMEVLFLIFLRKLHTVFHNSNTILHSTNSIQGFQRLHFLSNTCCLLCFW